MLVDPMECMDVPLKPLLVVLGILLATTGIFIYRVALVGFGGVLGGAAGLLVAIAIGGDLVLFIGVGLVGMVLGIIAVKQAYRTAIVAAGVLSGLAAGMYLAGASLSSPASLLDPLLAVGVVAGVVAAWLFDKVIVLVVSAAWGASLVAIGLAPPVADPTNITELVDAFVSPALLITFVVGVGVQVGLWAGLRYYGNDEGEPNSRLIGRLLGRGG